MDLDNIVSLVLVVIALLVAVWITLNFRRSLRRDGEPIWKRCGRYVRDVLDLFWGIG